MISVVMTTYNGEDYIRKQLDSIMRQEIMPDEMVIVDDASTDNTVKILNEYKINYLDVKWVIIENAFNIGWKKNFAKAIKAASGDYIFLSDQDDYWCSDKIRLMYDAMSNNDDIAVLAADYQTFKLTDFDPSIGLNEIYRGNGTVTKHKLTHNFYMVHYPGCNMAIRAEVKQWFDYSEWDGDLPHDEFIWCLAQLFGRAYVLNYKVLCYLRHIEAATAKKKRSRERQLELIKAKYMCVKKMASIYNRTADDAEVSMLINKAEKFLMVRVRFLNKPSVNLFVKLCTVYNLYERKSFFWADVISALL